MRRWSVVPALFLAGLAAAVALSTDVPDPADDEDATTLPPLVVHPAPNPLGDPLRNLRETLPDLGYKPGTKHSRLAEDINDAPSFQREFYTDVLNGDPRLSGPPAPYVTESDGTLAKRIEEGYRAVERAPK